MYWQLDKNIIRIMRLLNASYSISVAYSHKKCYQDFKDYLQKTQTVYSFEAGLIWLGKYKGIWKHSKYKANRLALYQLNDMFNTGTFLAHYVYENAPSYRRLPHWCRFVLDQYLEVERLSCGATYVAAKRIACSHFLEYLLNEGVQTLGEIGYHHTINYHDRGSHISTKGRDHYERMVRNFLEYLHHEIGLPLSISYSLNKFVVPYLKIVKNLTVAERERFNLVPSTVGNTLTAMEYLKMSVKIVNVVLPKHKYSRTVIKAFNKAYRLLFIL